MMEMVNSKNCPNLRPAVCLDRNKIDNMDELMVTTMDVDPTESALNNYRLFKEEISHFDNFRIKSYRIALKLRRLQRDSKFSLIDLYNTIEAFRDPTLTALANSSDLIPVSEVHQLLCNIFCQLSRRLPQFQTLDIDDSVTMIHRWLLETFQEVPSGFVPSLALKIGLTLLCSSLLSHKLKYLFTLLVNEQGQLSQESFFQFMKHIAEIGNYTEPEPILYVEEYLNEEKIPGNLEEFLATFENPGSSIRSWMIIYHRLPDAETVLQNVRCDSCGQEPFYGFRYKCKSCKNYNQCQQCFLVGKGSKNHDPDRHECKEYLFDRPSNLGQSLRKSFRRSSFRLRSNKQSSGSSPQIVEGGHQERKLSVDDNLIMKKLNLSHIVSPQMSKRNKNHGAQMEFRFDDLAVGTTSPSEYSESFASWSDPAAVTGDGSGFDAAMVVTPNLDGEHALIEFYLKLLNGGERKPLRYDTINENECFQKKIQELEMKNCHLMESITELRNLQIKQEESYNNDDTFFKEISSLRQKTMDLENYLRHLQDKRQDLMSQLDDVMKEFKQCNIGDGNPSRKIIND